MVVPCLYAMFVSRESSFVGILDHDPVRQRQRGAPVGVVERLRPARGADESPGESTAGEGARATIR